MITGKQCHCKCKWISRGESWKKMSSSPSSWSLASTVTSTYTPTYTTPATKVLQCYSNIYTPLSYIGLLGKHLLIPFPSMLDLLQMKEELKHKTKMQRCVWDQLLSLKAFCREIKNVTDCSTLIKSSDQVKDQLYSIEDTWFKYNICSKVLDRYPH